MKSNKRITVTVIPCRKITIITTHTKELFLINEYGNISKVSIEDVGLYDLYYNNTNYNFETEDEYPFDDARSLLEDHLAKEKLIQNLAGLMNTQLSIEKRKRNAMGAAVLIEVHPKIFSYAKKRMMECPLPEEAEISDEIISKLSIPLRELFKEISLKYRSDTDSEIK